MVNANMCPKLSDTEAVYNKIWALCERLDQIDGGKPFRSNDWIEHHANEVLNLKEQLTELEALYKDIFNAVIEDRQ